MSKRKSYLDYMVELWVIRNEFSEVVYSLNEVVRDAPSVIDYFVGLWKGALEDDRLLLYRLIICGAPIKECLDWGYKYDGLTEYEVTCEFQLWYIDKDGKFLLEPMSWSEYEVWLKKQILIDFPDG